MKGHHAALEHNQKSYIQRFHGCLRTTVSAPFINKLQVSTRLIVGNLFLIVVNWKNATGSSRLSTPTFSPTTHWALARSWTAANGTIQDEMEENIDLEPQLHAMMCPDMAARGSANSQMLLGSGPRSHRRLCCFHVVTLQTNKQRGCRCLPSAARTGFLHCRMFLLGA